MSTIKTVLNTAAVLLLGAVITSGYRTTVYQRERIDVLQKKLTNLQDQVISVQKQTTKNNTRLNQTIKAVNKNFETVSDGQDELRDTVMDIVAALKSGSIPSSSNLMQSHNGF